MDGELTRTILFMAGTPRPDLHVVQANVEYTDLAGRQIVKGLGFRWNGRAWERTASYGEDGRRLIEQLTAAGFGLVCWQPPADREVRRLLRLGIDPRAVPIYYRGTRGWQPTSPEAVERLIASA